MHQENANVDAMIAPPLYSPVEAASPLNGASPTFDEAVFTTISLPKPDLSIILPTRNEAGNVRALINRLEDVFADTQVEVIFVDDSEDDTVAEIQRAQEASPLCVRFLHREPSQRSGGLGSAVVAGLRLSRGPWTCVMDADLQHPPELIPALVEKAVRDRADLAVGSRYCQHGKSTGLNGLRTIVSRSFTAAAKLAFPSVLSRVSDPMSGFFVVRTAAIDLEMLRPNGFKILLEILARNPRIRVTEVGFEFGTRYAGESKASLREGMNYLSHLLTLRFGESKIRLGKFGIVGATGVLINLLTLAAVTELLGVHYLISVVVATQASTFWNFTFSDRWVFSGRRTSGRTWRGLQFFALNNAALVIRGPMIYVLTAGLFIHYTLSTLISLAVLGLIRFVISDSLIWGKERDVRVQLGFSYDIHGLITVRSDVRLPELQQFMVDSVIELPTINVRVGRNVRDWEQHAQSDPTAVSFAYDEGLGPVGFSIRMSMSNAVDVLASPILRWSPHVLYTNVVEPIVRWKLVKQGFALVHGACLAYHDKAFLVTARTDTGKTTTLLRILSRQRRDTDAGAFLSDDLTLVAADGRVLNYPKPLTISSHTVAAIDRPLLSWRERLALVVQSRLHSRDGRRFALFLATTRLPMATVNTIVQLLVPPPKYQIQRLVPGVRSVQESTLAGVFVIERGDDELLPLSYFETYNTLMRNSEDAFGFPPYSSIASFLQSANGQDLVSMEQEIVARAVTGLPAALVRSSRMDWSERIPEVIQTWSGDFESAERTIIPELALELGHD
jgi:dolichol-phosphate mannosyltransferase